MGERSFGESAETNPTSATGEGNSTRVEDLVEQLKLRSAQLEEANRELRRISHYRSLFLARVSHDLRTPLTSILGFSEILLDQEQLSDAQRRFCQKIQDSGMQLQASLNQLVDLSRLEVGQTELFVQEFSLREIFRESCAALTRSAQKRQINLEYDLANEITTIVSDQGKLRQVIYNFLAWSVSRSPRNSAVRIFADLPEPALLRICIDDQGDPIDDVARLFDPEAGGAREPDLNDLGIVIGRRLLEIMSGTVDLQNRETGLQTTIKVSARPRHG
jgi:signal transduction histidine kinase